MINIYPYANFHDLNLDRILKDMANLKAEVEALKGKQDKLTAGENITITADNVISAKGGGGDAGLFLVYDYYNNEIYDPETDMVLNYESLLNILADLIPIHAIYWENDEEGFARYYQMAQANYNNEEIIFTCVECNVYADQAKYHVMVIKSDDSITHYDYYRAITPDDVG